MNAQEFADKIDGSENSWSLIKKFDVEAKENDLVFILALTKRAIEVFGCIKDYRPVFASDFFKLGSQSIGVKAQRKSDLWEIKPDCPHATFRIMQDGEVFCIGAVIELSELESKPKTNTVKIKKLHQDAVVPSYATQGAACFDLSAIDYKDGAQPHQTIYSTGLAFEVPKDHVMLIFSRSGHGFKKGVRLSNCVGVIDSDYRGEVQVALTNDGLSTDVECGRIAQAMILPVQQVAFEVVDELSSTERGNDGFGSTGE